MKELQFGGFTWIVKDGLNLPPRNNNWSDKLVSIDEKGLKLKIRKLDGKWFCSELKTKESIQYGEYHFNIETNIRKLHKSIVAGLFIYQDDNHELDIEIYNGKIHYSVQPDTNSFGLDTPYPLSRFKIVYTEKYVSFGSYFDPLCYLDPYMKETYYEHTTYKGNFPVPDKSRLHINFWLRDGGAEQDLVIKDFKFKPI